MFGGGVLVYASDKIAIKPKIVLEYDDDDEMLWTEFHFSSEKKLVFGIDSDIR